MHVEEHEVVALLGRNGAGKSTTLKSLMGVVQPKSGTIRHNGEEIQHLSAPELAQRGIQLVPAERRIFGSITVHEHLPLSAMTVKNPQSLAAHYNNFSLLVARRRNSVKQFSAGEPQILTLHRAIIPHAHH